MNERQETYHPSRIELLQPDSSVGGVPKLRLYCLASPRGGVLFYWELRAVMEILVGKGHEELVKNKFQIRRLRTWDRQLKKHEVHHPIYTDSLVL